MKCGFKSKHAWLFTRYLRTQKLRVVRCFGNDSYALALAGDVNGVAVCLDSSGETTFVRAYVVHFGTN